MVPATICNLCSAVELILASHSVVFLTHLRKISYLFEPNQLIDHVLSGQFNR